jgi:hypothetical protein
MISVASWAHRTLRGTARYHHCGDEPAYCEPYRDWAVEKVIGVYENPTDVAPHVIVITEGGIYSPSENGPTCIRFENLRAISGPDSKSGAGAIELVEHDGRRSTLTVAGGDGNHRDVFNMVRFLDRVLARDQ